MIPHNMTLFKFICVQYQFYRQTLPIMKIDRGQIQFREYVSTGTEPLLFNIYLKSIVINKPFGQKWDIKMWGNTDTTRPCVTRGTRGLTNLGGYKSRAFCIIDQNRPFQENKYYSTQ